MTEEDFQAFRRIQKKYFQRVSEDDESLLARIYGIYSVRMEDQNPVKFDEMGTSLYGASLTSPGHRGFSLSHSHRLLHPLLISQFIYFSKFS